MAAVRQAHRHANDRIEKAKSETRKEQAKEDAGVGLASWLGGKEEKEPAPPKQVGKTGQFRVASGGDEAAQHGEIQLVGQGERELGGGESSARRTAGVAGVRGRSGANLHGADT